MFMFFLNKVWQFDMEIIKIRQKNKVCLMLILLCFCFTNLHKENKSTILYCSTKLDLHIDFVGFLSLHQFQRKIKGNL